MASWLSSVQKNVLGKTFCWSDLSESAISQQLSCALTYRANSFRSSASGAALGSAAAWAIVMVGVRRARGGGGVRLQRTRSGLCGDGLFHQGVVCGRSDGEAGGVGRRCRA